MSSKFENVTVDEGTKILVQLDTKFGDIDVRYEKWIWDGITGESLIFLSEDIAQLTENEIIDQIRKSTLSTKSDETIKRGRNLRLSILILLRNKN